MSFRITTNGVFRNYRANLTNNTKKMNDAMTRVETGRLFNSYAEDPAAASKAFQLRRSYWRAGDQIDNSNYLISKFQTGWNALDAIVDGTVEQPGLDGIMESMRGLTGTAGSTRVPLGTELVSMADSITQVMNVRYGDEYVFAGADGLNVPFSWTEAQDENGNDIKRLLYRNIDVTTGEVYQMNQDTGKLEKTGEVKSEADLRKMAEEATYVDIGLGMQADENGDVIPSSAYNSALSGLSFLGYGVDEDGDSRNLAVLMNELGEIFSRSDPDSGDYQSDEDADRAAVLMKKVGSAVGYVQEQHALLDAKAAYLNRNLNELEDTQVTLGEQIEDTERMDMAAAITEMMWAQYSYNAALRVGSQILSQSLIDYLS